MSAHKRNRARDFGNQGAIMNQRIASPGLLLSLCATAVIGCLVTPRVAQAQACTPDFDLIGSPNAERHNSLKAAAVVADDDVWAVGLSFMQENTAPYHTLIEHWNGAQWAIVPAPTPPVSSQLLGVSAVATDDVWAVGANVPQSGFVPPQPLIEHWDGVQWTIVPSPNPNGWSWLNAVSALASDDVWAAGESRSEAVFMHWDGNEWTVVRSPDDAGKRFALTAVARDDIWSSGESRLFGDDTHIFTHWDGTSWTTVANPQLGDGVADLFGISAVTTNDIWSVGRAQSSICDDTCIDLEFAEVEHWDGTGWQLVAGPLTSYGYSSLQNVTAQSAQGIWVTGHSGGTIVALWDGTRWIDAPSIDGGNGGGFASLAPTPNGGVWAVGTIVAGSQRRTLTARYFCR
jgi:hypothetical protein